MSTASLTLSASASMPKLPGYSLNRDPSQQDFKRQGMFDVVSGVPVEKRKPLANSRSTATLVRAGNNDSFATIQSWEEDAQWYTSSRGVHNERSSMSPTSDYSNTPTKREPRFVELDRKVLRFFGYFKEPVHESATENFRLRKLKVLYYLEDDTMLFIEPRQENSGAPQGPFLRRATVPRPDSGGESYIVDDLRVGSNLSVFGRTIHLVDCDNFTRSHYEQLGLPQPPSQEYPTDLFLESRSKSTVPTHSRDPEFSSYIEAQAGGGKPKNLVQFFEHDGEVLRFFTKWQNPPARYEGGEEFEIHYFMADDSMEVYEIQPWKGKGSKPYKNLILKRSKLAKEYNFKQPGMNAETLHYYHASELTTGAIVNVFGKRLRILGADRYTQEYFPKHFGKTIEAMAAPSRSPAKERVHREVEIPPHHGYGTEEDSMGSVYRLVPRIPKKDIHKLLEKQRVVLRYAVKIVRPDGSTADDRKFVLTFYLADDTLAIFEPAIKNSGNQSGKFLERNRYKNPSTANDRGETKYFTHEDMQVGSIVSINRHLFKILEMDQFTTHLLSGNLTHSAPDITLVESKLRQALLGQKMSVTEIFRRLDVNHDFKVSFDEFADEIKRLHFDLTDQEVMMLYAYYDKDESGLIDYKEFLERLDPSSHPQFEPRSIPPLTRGESLEEQAKLAQADIEKRRRIAKAASRFVIRMTNCNQENSEIWRDIVGACTKVSLQRFKEQLTFKKSIYDPDNADLCEFFFDSGSAHLTYHTFAAKMDELVNSPEIMNSNARF